MINNQPPGTILQLMYLRQRIRENFGNKKVHFCEMGSGIGAISNLLLSMGHSGVGFDLNAGACLKNSELNNFYCNSGNYRIINENFIESSISEKFDLIISCMVIEHLDENLVLKFINKCKALLSAKGFIITLVPSQMVYWGIEDDIAGHLRRYEVKDILEISQKTQMKINKIQGLTFPVSNLLLPISNYLVKKNESKKMQMSNLEKTIESGNRDVKYKTKFPLYLSLILNEIIMYPFFLFQKLNIFKNRSLVLYFELERSMYE